MVSSEIKAMNRVKWRHLLNDIVITCFRVADVVLPVVSNSSPEGNIPDDVTAEYPPGQLYLINCMSHMYCVFSLNFVLLNMSYFICGP